MADFNKAFNLMIANEGGYVNDPQDPGGETYKGIARKIWPDCQIWVMIDALKQKSALNRVPVTSVEIEIDNQLQLLVKEFYYLNFWQKIKGDAITDQDIANAIFDFAVNAGISTSASLAQMITGASVDGKIGKDSILAINDFDSDHFIAAFTVAKIARYVSIVKKRPTSRKYFYGWVLRALGEKS